MLLGSILAFLNHLWQKLGWTTMPTSRSQPVVPLFGQGGLWSAATTSLAPLKGKMQQQRCSWWCSPTRSGTVVPRAPFEEKRSWQQPSCSRGEGDALNTQIWAGCVWLHSQRWGPIKTLLLCCTCQTQPVRDGISKGLFIKLLGGCWEGGREVWALLTMPVTWWQHF